MIKKSSLNNFKYSINASVLNQMNKIVVIMKEFNEKNGIRYK